MGNIRKRANIILSNPSAANGVSYNKSVENNQCAEIICAIYPKVKITLCS